jgi:hypothetical protein
MKNNTIHQPSGTPAWENAGGKPGRGTEVRATSVRSSFISLAVLCGAATVLLLAARSCQQAAAGGLSAAAGSTARVVESAGRALGSVFGGQVTVSNSGVVSVPGDISELAVLRSDTAVVGKFTKTRAFGWFRSTLVVTGHYRGKIGIDLGAVKGRLDPDTRALELELPRCEVLSVELLDLEHIYSDDWFLNRLTTEQTVDLARRNAVQARSQLDNPELLRAADKRLRKALREALEPAGITLKIKEPAG